MAPTDTTALSEELVTEEITLRGRKLVLRELEFGEFAQIEKQATPEVVDPETGLKMERFDERLQQKLMVAKSVVSSDPPLPEGGVEKLGNRATIALLTVVNKLNYGEVDPTTGRASALYTETKNGASPTTPAKAGKNAG